MDTYEAHLKKTTQAAKDWIFWYTRQKERGSKLDILAEPMYNICMSYVVLVAKYLDTPVWDKDDAKESAARLIDKVNKLREEEENKND